MSRTDGHYLPSLDGLRAISIVLVVLGHAFVFTAPPALAHFAPVFDGTLGVRIFFVISGYLISTLLLREEASGGISLKRFYLRRFLRLAPVQLAYIAALVLLSRNTALSETPCQVLTAVTYTKNYACSGWFDGHFWSLSVEEQFYLFWPTLMAVLPRKRLLPVALALVLLAPASRAIQYCGGARNYTWLTSNVDLLMCGCLAALVRGRPLWNKILAVSPAVGRLVAVLLIALPTVLSAHFWFGAFTVTLGPVLQGAACAYLISSLIEHPGGAWGAALNFAPISFLGRMSYSLYVWQQLFFAKPADYGWDYAWPLQFPVNMAFALLAGLASYMLIERPMAGLRARLRRPRPRTEPLVAAMEQP